MAKSTLPTFLTVGTILAAALVLFWWVSGRPDSAQTTVTNAPTNHVINSAVELPTNLTNGTTESESIPTNTPIVNAAQPRLTLPMADFFSRVTKKPFGIYITPQNSPIQPEKFTGYHTGADAEATDAAEAKIDVPIYALAAGTVVFAGHVNGYGGVLIIKHTIDGEKLLSLYGHLRISSFTVKVKSSVMVGQQIAVLGSGNSSETDGEREHLHFGLIKGWTITYKGYVTSRSALSGWEDPVTWLKVHGVAAN